jgi:hypothetical protein
MTDLSSLKKPVEKKQPAFPVRACEFREFETRTLILGEDGSHDE